MVDVLRAYHYCVDKSVQISQDFILIKGHNPNFDHESKIVFLIKQGIIIIFFMPGTFGSNLSANLNIALRYMNTLGTTG